MKKTTYTLSISAHSVVSARARVLAYGAVAQQRNADGSLMPQKEAGNRL